MNFLNGDTVGGNRCEIQQRYGEQMVQGLPIPAKYQHHLYISKCSAYNSFKVYYYVFIFHIYSFKIEKINIHSSSSSLSLTPSVGEPYVSM